MTETRGALFDPVELAQQTMKQVCDGEQRKYYRFRRSRFYGGIATADCVGCCLRCIFCWSWNVVSSPLQVGTLHRPEEVASTLMGIARKKRIRQLRISGNEPTLAWEHLVKVLELVEDRFLFILETNGILIGAHEECARDLARFRNLHARISLKGACAEEFSRLTRALPHGFALQLSALERLTRAGVSTHAACMVSFSTPDTISSLRKELRTIDPHLGDLEVEELTLYPHVEQRLRNAHCTFYTAHQSDRVPPEQV